MTIKAGDKVQVFRDGKWSSTLYTVLCIQDKDKSVHLKRQWAVVAFESDIPKVFELDKVRKEPKVTRHIRRGYLLPDGSVILGDIQHPDLHIPILVSYTTVDGKIDLSKGTYTVTERDEDE